MKLYFPCGAEMPGGGPDAELPPEARSFNSHVSTVMLTSSRHLEIDREMLQKSQL